MFLVAFKDSRRFWFKRTLDYQKRTQSASMRPGDGWAWLEGFEHKMDKAKIDAKKITRRLGYTRDSEYAESVRAAKKEWFERNPKS